MKVSLGFIYVSLVLLNEGVVCSSNQGFKDEVNEYVAEDVNCKQLVPRPKNCDIMPSNPLLKCDVDEESQTNFCEAPINPHHDWPRVHMPLSIVFFNVTSMEEGEHICTGVSDCIGEIGIRAFIAAIMSIILTLVTITSMIQLVAVVVCVMLRNNNSNSHEDTDKDPVIGELVYNAYTGGVNVGSIDDRSLPVFLPSSFNGEVNHLAMDHEGNVIFQRPLQI